MTYCSFKSSCSCTLNVNMEANSRLLPFLVWFDQFCCLYELVLKIVLVWCLWHILVWLAWYTRRYGNPPLCVYYYYYLLWCQNLSFSALCMQLWRELRASIDCKMLHLLWKCWGGTFFLPCDENANSRRWNLWKWMVLCMYMFMLHVCCWYVLYGK